MFPFSGDICCSQNSKPHKTEPGKLFCKRSRYIEEIPGQHLPHHTDGHDEKNSHQDAFCNFIYCINHDDISSIRLIKSPILLSSRSLSLSGSVACRKDSIDLKSVVEREMG